MGATILLHTLARDKFSAISSLYSRFIFYSVVSLLQVCALHLLSRGLPRQNTEVCRVATIQYGEKTSGVQIVQLREIDLNK